MLSRRIPVLDSPILVDGLQGDETLLTTFRGTWFAWSDANRSIGPGDALRSFVAFLLPGS